MSRRWAEGEPKVDQERTKSGRRADEERKGGGGGGGEVSAVPSAGICVGPAVCMYWVEWGGSGSGVEWDGDREGLEGVVWCGVV